MRQGIESEKIEEYILGRLSPKETAQIEAAMAMDPLLKSEVSVQRAVISSLQATRKAELKARLSNLQTPSGSWWSAPKIAASLLLFLSASGSILYFMQEKLEKSTESKISLAPVSKDYENSNITKPINPEKSPLIENELQKKEIYKEEKVATKATIIKHTPQDTAIPNVEIPDLDEDFESIADLDKNIALPESGLNSSNIDGRNKTIEVKILEEKDNFNYQYFNNKLFLHGDFNNIQYEVLELNTHNGKQVFLYFNDSYFSIAPNTFDITLLKPLLDPELKKQLDSLRN